MKLAKYLFQTIALGIVLALPLSFSSCEDKEDKIEVSQVYVQSVSDTESVITEIRLGNKLRIEGSGFSTVHQVLINGVEVSGINSNYITNNVIMVTVPTSIPIGSDVENPEDLNTIRIITKFDNYVFSFTILGEAPSIASVSHTMPQAGSRIRIEGSALNDIERVIFPGGAESTDFTISSDNRMIDVLVPNGIGNNQGAVTVDGPNGSASSLHNFNYQKGLFLTGFAGDPVYGYGSGSISGNQSASVPAGGDGPKSPATYRFIPAEPEDRPLAPDGQTVGGFVYSMNLAIEKVLAENDDLITGETLVSDLAIQADYYFNVPWTNGSLRLILNGNGSGNQRISPVPWNVSGEVVPITFTGWRTMTWNLSDLTDQNNGGVASPFIALTLAGLKEALGTGNNSGQIIWICGNFQDRAGNWSVGTPMSSAQMAIGNIRFVPNVRVSADSE